MSHKLTFLISLFIFLFYNSIYNLSLTFLISSFISFFNNSIYYSFKLLPFLSSFFIHSVLIHSLFFVLISLHFPVLFTFSCFVFVYSSWIPHFSVIFILTFCHFQILFFVFLSVLHVLLSILGFTTMFLSFSMWFPWFHCNIPCFISIPQTDLKIPFIKLSYVSLFVSPFSFSLTFSSFVSFHSFLALFYAHFAWIPCFLMVLMTIYVVFIRFGLLFCGFQLHYTFHMYFSMSSFITFHQFHPVFCIHLAWISCFWTVLMAILCDFLLDCSFSVIFDCIICFIIILNSFLFVCVACFIVHFGVHYHISIALNVISMVLLSFDMIHFYPLKWSQNSI